MASTQQIQPIVDARAVPPVGVRPSYFPQGLRPGEFQKLSGFRFNDGCLTVRLGTKKIISSLPAGGATPIDLQAMEIGGTQYLVGAFAVSGKIAIFSSTSPFSSWTEISETSGWAGDSSGNSRFPTVSPRVTFASARSPYSFINGNPLPSHDLLVIQNGEDFPRLYDPSGEAGLKFTICQPVTVPSNAAKALKQVSTFANFVPMAGTSPKSLAASSGAVQKSSFKFAAPLTGVYSASPNICVSLTAASGVTPAQAGDIASFKNSGTVNPFGSQMIFIVEGAQAPTLFAQAKIEINSDAANIYASVTQPWNVVWDPQDVTGTYRMLLKQLDASTSNPRWLLAFPLDHLQTGSQRTPYHLRFTRVGPAPAADQTMTILALCSGGLFPGGSEWSVSYEDAYGFSESPGIVPSYELGDALSNIGGPSVVTSQTVDGIVSSTFNLPAFGDILYDYIVTFPNADGAQVIAGGLQGQPTRANLYLRLPGEPTPYYLYSTGLYQPELSIVFGGVTIGKGWYKENVGAQYSVASTATSGGHVTVTTTSTHSFQVGDTVTVFGTGNSAANGTWVVLTVPTTTTVTIGATSGSSGVGGVIFKPTALVSMKTGTGSYTLTPANRDFSRSLPVPYQIPIPIAQTVFSGSNRLFAGAVKDPVTGQKFLGDLYFSCQENPFRFQSNNLGLDGNTNPLAGNRLSLSRGTIQHIDGAAAAADGQSYIYVWTSQDLWALGGSSGISSGSFDSDSLARAIRIASLGTNAPRSIAQRNGVFFFLDNENQIRRFAGGEPADISRLNVDSILKALPAARRLAASGTFCNDRYLLSVTSAGGSTNDLVMGWNNVRNIWEFVDEGLPFHPERLTRLYDASQDGSGQRLVSLGSDGLVYVYDEGADDLGSPIAVKLKTPEYAATPWNPVTVDSLTAILDAQAHTLNVDAEYRLADQAGTYRQTMDLSKGWATSNGAHSALSALDDGERGSSVAIELSGSMDAGTRVLHLSADLRLAENVEARSS